MSLFPLQFSQFLNFCRAFNLVPSRTSSIYLIKLWIDNIIKPDWQWILPIVCACAYCLEKVYQLHSCWYDTQAVPFHSPLGAPTAQPFLSIPPKQLLCSAVCKVSSHASFHCDWRFQVLHSWSPLLHSVLYLTFVNGKVFVLGTSNTTYILSDQREVSFGCLLEVCALVTVSLLDVSHSLWILFKLS